MEKVQALMTMAFLKEDQEELERRVNAAELQAVVQRNSTRGAAGRAAAKGRAAAAAKKKAAGSGGGGGWRVTRHALVLNGGLPKECEFRFWPAVLARGNGNPLQGMASC